MNDERKQELRESLASQLLEETRQRSLNARERAAWLGERLAEYVDRWLKFCEVTGAEPANLTTHVLWAAVEVGSDELAEELVRSHAPLAVRAHWEEFREHASLMGRAHTTLPDARELPAILGAWREMMSKSQWP